MSLQTLLTRKTTRNFVSHPIKDEIIETALRVAHRTPTSVNSRPTTIIDITNKRGAPWLLDQQATKTAERIFLFCWNAAAAEKNIRTTLTRRFGMVDEVKISTMLDRFFHPNPAEFCRCQTYLTAGYFAASLESQSIAGCFIAGFDRTGAKDALSLPPNVEPELIFACGYPDPVNPGTYPTEGIRDFRDFYFSNF